MDSLNKILSIIFYLIWIPLGLVLLAGIIFVIVANPLGQIMGMLGGSGGLPSEDMMKQFQQQGPGGQFGQPTQ